MICSTVEMVEMVEIEWWDMYLGHTFHGYDIDENISGNWAWQ